MDYAQATRDELVEALTASTEALYHVFRGYGLRPHIEGCPCCTTDADNARVRVRPLRALTGDDLDTVIHKSMTTWGDADDFRHFLPRVLELIMNAESYSSDVEIVLDKLAYAHWWEWPDRERSAVKTFLRVRWNLGLTQAPKYTGTDDEEEFDVNAWLCGIGLSALDLEPYVEDWKSRGALSTLGHLVAFIEDNPKLARGELRNAFWTPFHAARCAELMGPWVAALMDDPTFQEHLAAWYEA